ncbi:hypothetical protein [Fuerstiella marisgermanici]|nr:hypothetical protein [Fuerstiella marisgermanici]
MSVVIAGETGDFAAFVPVAQIDPDENTAAAIYSARFDMTNTTFEASNIAAKVNSTTFDMRNIAATVYSTTFEGSNMAAIVGNMTFDMTNTTFEASDIAATVYSTTFDIGSIAGWPALKRWVAKQQDAALTADKL